MDPLVQIEVIAGGSAFASAVLVGTVSPILLSILNNRQRRRERAEDYAERHEVARKAEETSQRIEVAAKNAAVSAKDALSAIAENTELTQKIEISTNSMKDALVAATAKASDLAGEKRGREDEIARRS